MTREEIYEKVIGVMKEEFDDENLEINDRTTAREVDGWDSLSHLSLLHEIEGLFGIKFSMSEIQGLKNVGELIDAIHVKVSA